MDENQTNQNGDNITYFPRLTHFNLDSSLIQIHLEIFSYLKYIFTKFLELREQLISKNGGLLNHKTKEQNQAKQSFQEKLFYKKLKMDVPEKLTLKKWNQMSLTE